mmetsp:Transcript_86018/g.238280  ORF Transcript_86018/g.238280 Transcript_86018/m.238280 type:complete len:239 (+) Transcript_86018:135-851(+)
MTYLITARCSPRSKSSCASRLASSPTERRPQPGSPSSACCATARRKELLPLNNPRAPRSSSNKPHQHWWTAGSAQDTSWQDLGSPGRTGSSARLQVAAAGLEAAWARPCPRRAREGLLRPHLRRLRCRPGRRCPCHPSLGTGLPPCPSQPPCWAVPARFSGGPSPRSSPACAVRQASSPTGRRQPPAPPGSASGATARTPAHSAPCNHRSSRSLPSTPCRHLWPAAACPGKARRPSGP